MTHLRIDNARVIDPANKLDEQRTLFIRDGVFTDQSGSDQCDHDAQVIDAKGLIACPGFIDMYARLREPGFTRKGTIESESQAALKAGFTTVFCAPDTHPVIDSSATVELIKQKAVVANGARVSPIAAFTAGLEGKLLSELATLYNAGCLIAGHADHPVTDTGVLLSTMEYASSFNIPLMIRPFDPAIASGGCAHDGAIATRLGLPGIPVAAETVALARLIELCTSTGCHLHISRVGSARAIELLRSAKKKGLPITADVGIHHLYFTDEQIKHYDANFHSAVPFRSVEDRAALREALRDGTLDAICSDHAPHDNDAKLAPFPSSAAGLSAFDAFAPLLFGLPDLLDMPLMDVIDKVTCGPAAIVAAKNNKLAAIQTGLLDASSYSLAIGSQADLVLIDPDSQPNLSIENMASLGKNSPLAGVTSLTELTGEDVAMRAQVMHSIIAGNLRV